MLKLAIPCPSSLLGVLASKKGSRRDFQGQQPVSLFQSSMGGRFCPIPSCPRLWMTLFIHGSLRGPWKTWNSGTALCKFGLPPCMSQLLISPSTRVSFRQHFALTSQVLACPSLPNSLSTGLLGTQSWQRQLYHILTWSPFPTLLPKMPPPTFPIYILGCVLLCVPRFPPNAH